jgi:ADP-heptose:LPS heptosyltransferase/GT2 family glycosyltransferase
MIPKFSISVIAFNKLEFTKKCIASIYAAGGDFEIILTDNNSTDGTAAYFDELAAKDKRVHVIHNTENRYFNEPSNYACLLAKGKYIVLLNNDATVPLGWLNHLEQPFKDHPDTAAISGPSETCRSFQNPFPSWHGSPGGELEYIEGSCLCIPTELARKYTLFAPYLKKCYSEDADLSLRMRAMGKTIHQAPFAIKHHRGATSNGMEGMAEIQMANSAVMTEKWSNYHKYRRFDLPIIIDRTEALGDVLLVTPLIRALREQMPRSELFFETGLPHVLKYNMKVKKRAPYEHWDGSMGDQDLYRWARKISLNMSYENMLETHIVDGFFQKALVIPCEKNYRWTENYWAPEDDAWAEEHLTRDDGPNRKWVAVHCGPSTWDGKAWPQDRFQKVCLWLMDHGYRIVLVGNLKDRSFAHHLDLRGGTSLQQLGAVLKRCKFFVGLDSYILHAAESVNIPVIGLFGVTDPNFIMTRDPSYSIMGTAPCAGARHRVTGKHQMQCGGACIKSISFEQVVEKMEMLS